MQPIKLILSDIDGTIMPSGRNRVSERTRRAFHTALDAGIVAGVASGRNMNQIPPFFSGDEACCATCIATNGLEIYHERELVARGLPDRAALARLIDVLADIPGTGLVAFEHGTDPYLCCGELEDMAVAVPAYARVASVVNRLPEFDIIKVNVFTSADMAGTVELCDRLNGAFDELDFDVPMRGFLNIMPAGWNKGAAVRRLCDHLGISTDEAAVFGDAGNDLAMFAVAGHPVAVAGATPEAAAAARWHIGRCEDDAVAAAIEALAAGTWPFTDRNR